MRTTFATLLLLLPLTALPTLAGDLTTRYDLTLHRVLTGSPPAYTDDFLLADAIPSHTRRFTNFSGDVSGRYLDALSAVSLQSHQPFPSLDRLVEKLLPLQKPDGHFGDPLSPPSSPISNADMATLWGNGRLLVGLLTFHDLHPDRQDVLAVATKLGDCLINISPRLNTDPVQKQFSDNRIAVGYICWTQTIEGLVKLARSTHDPKYTDLAKQIAARTAFYPAGHSHGFLTSLRGILDLHHLTNDPQYLALVEKEWQNLHDTHNVLIQGALPEAFKPLDRRDEGCSEADWLRLNLALYRTTSNPKYLDAAETCYFNEFSFNQFPTGDFGHHTLTPTGVSPPNARAWWCCTFHGLRTFPDLQSAAFATDGMAPRYDLPIDGTFTSPTLSLRADSHLDQDGTVTIEVLRSDGQEHTIEVRMPPWSNAVTLQSDGAGGISSKGDRGTLLLSKAWTKGDRLHVHYDLQTRTVHDPANPKRVAFFHGPWLLAVDDATSPTYFDEPHPSNRIQLPLTGTTLHYYPGGYPMQPQTATLHPLADQTHRPDNTTWEFWFTPKE